MYIVLLIIAQVTSPKLEVNTRANHKMAYLMIFISALHFTISSITCAVHNFTSIDGGDFPYVHVTSLQNNNSNCLINNYDSKGITVIQSNELSVCSFQLFASYNVAINLEVVNISNPFLYVELEEQQFCTGRVLLLTGENNICANLTGW